MGASRIIGVLVVASKAVDAGTPVDASQVVDAVGKGQELVFVICCTVVVAVAVSVDCHGRRRNRPRGNALEELAVPVVVAGQDGGHVVAANEDRLHASIDSASLSVLDMGACRHGQSETERGQVQVVVERQAQVVVRVDRDL
jgi:hypothetical protein